MVVKAGAASSCMMYASYAVQYRWIYGHVRMDIGTNNGVRASCTPAAQRSVLRCRSTQAEPLPRLLQPGSASHAAPWDDPSPRHWQNVAMEPADADGAAAACWPDATASTWTLDAAPRLPRTQQSSEAAGLADVSAHRAAGCMYRRSWAKREATAHRCRAGGRPWRQLPSDAHHRDCGTHVEVDHATALAQT